ncbi:substrate-binding domain-containing protein [Nannocystis pusilla]|uniref:substrate-binding domain-containing protein n=1 Tax=Nannocystis pusilla TaxID=889268 RepID=UPI003DA41F4A
MLITLARWEAGLLLAPGNPRKIRGAADLGRRGLRLVARETGSGSRRLLERELVRAGLSAALAGAAPVRASGHLEVAQAIASGAGEVGVATRDAAIAFGLEFVPLAEERYDLAIPRALLADPRLERFLDAMTSAAFRRELSSLGYDVRGCGDRVAELDAA